MTDEMDDFVINTGEMTEEHFNSVQDQMNKQFFKSRLRFLNSHQGLRPGELHTLIAPKGGGKSSFVRTILSELLMSEVRTYTFLSEEDRDFYVSPLFSCFNEIIKDEAKTNFYLSNLIIDSQLDFKASELNLEYFLNRIEKMMSICDCKVFILDNLTTSFLASQFNAAEKFASELKRLAVKYKVAVLVVLHTQKGTDVYRDVIDAEHVRGNATIVNLGSYNYVLTAFFRCTPTRVFVNIDKARYHSEANKTVWELSYDKSVGLFTKDMASGYHVIQGIITAIKKADKKRG